MHCQSMRLIPSCYLASVIFALATVAAGIAGSDYLTDSRELSHCLSAQVVVASQVH